MENNHRSRENLNDFETTEHVALLSTWLGRKSGRDTRGGYREQQQHRSYLRQPGVLRAARKDA